MNYQSVHEIDGWGTLRCTFDGTFAVFGQHRLFAGYDIFVVVSCQTLTQALSQ